MLQTPSPVLPVVMQQGYTGDSELTVNLTGRLTKCGVTSPRSDVQLKDLEKWQNNLLPSCQICFTVLITSVGIMDHEEIRRKYTGGKILGFFFLWMQYIRANKMPQWKKQYCDPNNV